MITIPLLSHCGTPMYIQIYDYIKREILAGHLSAGEKLPSARALSAHLNVSRSTVDTAYEQLVAEGYLDSKPKSGFYVNAITYLQQFDHANKTTLSDEKPSLSHTSTPYDFDPYAVDIENFPFSTWKSLGKYEYDKMENFVAGDHMGEWPLRQAIANYLRGSRGVITTPDQVIIGAGLSHLLQMLCILFQRDISIAMEDPGYRTARRVLSSGGCHIVDIPISNDALDIDKLYASKADVCFVTPSHQFPLASVMPISERHKLLAWASQSSERYIIEDDHDSEFRYKGRPIPALQSLDTADKVIYIGTFSKAISPAIRVGYMVLPQPLLRCYVKLCGDYACPVSKTGQAVLTDFIQQGYFEKHLNRMRKIYKTKRDHMLQAIERHFDCCGVSVVNPYGPNPTDLQQRPRVAISGDHAGLYILLSYLGPLTESQIEDNAKKIGIKLCSLGGYYSQLPADYIPTYLIGYANLNEEMIDSGIKDLALKVFA